MRIIVQKFSGANYFGGQVLFPEAPAWVCDGDERRRWQPWGLPEPVPPAGRAAACQNSPDHAALGASSADNWYDTSSD